MTDAREPSAPPSRADDGTGVLLNTSPAEKPNARGRDAASYRRPGGPRPAVGVLAVQGAFAEHIAMLERLGTTCIELRAARDLARPFDRLVLPGGESTVQGKLLRELGMMDELRARILDGMPVLGTCAGLILLAETIDDPREDGGPRGIASGAKLGTCAGLILLAETIDDPREDGGPRGIASGANGANGGDPACCECPGQHLGSSPLVGQRVDARASVPVSGMASVRPERHLGTLPATVRRNAYGRQLGSFHVRAEFTGLGEVPMSFIRAPYVSEVGPGTQVLAMVDRRIVAVRHGNQLGVAFHPELDPDPRIHELLLAL